MCGIMHGALACPLTIIWARTVCCHNRNFLAIFGQSRVEHVTIAVLPVPEVSPEFLETAA